MLNARIRKTFVKKGIPIFSIGNPGDLTYDYKLIGNKTEDVKDIINQNSEFSKVLLSAKKPLIIIGESALELESGKYIFEELKKFLNKNKFVNEDWNALNILAQNASTVGLVDLKILPNEKNDYSFFEKFNIGKFKFLYLLGSDNIEIKKENEFIVYQGSHGDRGAEIADIVLPSAAYTEQDGLYENLEGRVQECRKASYPIGEAKEDWKILNLILKKINKNIKTFKFDDIRKDVLNHISNFAGMNQLPEKKVIQHTSTDNKFISEEILIKPIDYYFSNSISRASKTMSDCRQINKKAKKTG